jgi:Anti-sigma-K factor rskA/Putative zinc-finger
VDPRLSHDALVELMGAFALDAADPAEVAAIQSHLGVCPRCRDEVTHFRQAAAVLANTGGEAPAGVWDAIAARIEAAPRVTTQFPLLPRPASDEPIFLPPRPRVARRAAAGAAAVVAAAVALLGLEVGHLDHRLNQVTAASAGQTLTGAARAALLDPTAQRITLARVGPGSSPAAQVVVQGSGAAFLFNQGLPALPPGQTYQLWAMIDGQPISVAVLGAHPATVAFSVDFAAATKAFAVTVEPAGGSVAPTRASVAGTTA